MNTLQNGLRPIGVTYSSGKEITYEYDNVNRVVAIKEGETDLVRYEYLGLNSIMKTEYVEPGLTLDYTVSGALGRFGRIVDHAWKNTQGTDIVRIGHGYDLAGNRLYRNNTTQSNSDELYSYDDTNQIKAFARK